MTRFYTGSPEPAWLERTPRRLFVAYPRLLRLVAKLPRSPEGGGWALDSGGFNLLRKYGTWVITPERYVTDVIKYADKIGNLAWAAPQDWMCEADIFKITGLDAPAHQALTVANYLDLARLWPTMTDRPMLIVPALQGDPELPPDKMVASYLECWSRYEDAGVDLASVGLVGLGSVCRQQATDKIVTLVEALHDRAPGVQLHGFGCKIKGLERLAQADSPGLFSADSQAWSKHARSHHIKIPGCTMRHQVCNYCLHYAMWWTDNHIAILEG